MNILYLISYAGKAGTEKYVANLMRTYSTQGHRCFLAYMDGGELAEKARALGCGVFRLDLRAAHALAAAKSIARLCAENGVTVCAIPGPCALVTALSISGLPTGRFTFEGFLSVNKKSRQEHLTGLKDETRTMIFYEAPHKLLATLRDLADAFGEDRKISLCRELTKLHEEVRRMTLGEAAAYYEETPPRGEFVLVVAGAEEKAEEGCTFEAALDLVRARMAEGLSTKDAVKQVAKLTGFAKNLLYDAVVK